MSSSDTEHPATTEAFQSVFNAESVIQPDVSTVQPVTEAQSAVVQPEDQQQTTTTTDPQPQPASECEPASQPRDTSTTSTTAPKAPVPLLPTKEQKTLHFLEEPPEEPRDPAATPYEFHVHDPEKNTEKDIWKPDFVTYKITSKVWLFLKVMLTNQETF